MLGKAYIQTTYKDLPVLNRVLNSTHWEKHCLRIKNHIPRWHIKICISRLPHIENHLWKIEEWLSLLIKITYIMVCASIITYWGWSMELQINLIYQDCMSWHIKTYSDNISRFACLESRIEKRLLTIAHWDDSRIKNHILRLHIMIWISRLWKSHNEDSVFGSNTKVCISRITQWNLHIENSILRSCIEICVSWIAYW